MAKVQQKSEIITAFGGIFFVLDKFDSILSSVIDSHLGLRSRLIGYQYSEIIRAVFSVFCCGGDCLNSRWDRYLGMTAAITQLPVPTATGQGKASVGNRLTESIGQTNRVLLNMKTDYNGRLLASDIKSFFEKSRDAIEVLVFKGNKTISIKRGLVQNPAFNRLFRKLYEK